MRRRRVSSGGSSDDVHSGIFFEGGLNYGVRSTAGFGFWPRGDRRLLKGKM